ncbi:MICOS complex subunit Mic60 [Liparis tanakae]|uniref:MICOS complex subunit MIC60 n=1 Tax=Liparis tanakae TaxID=230148 RepID=A0A4Z2GYF9_9TELE|nr:MICOS complex subunit Mic60 [Liparis tanakae]
MLRACLRGANATARRNSRRTPLTNLQQCRQYTGGESSGAGKVVAAGLVTVGGGVGGTILYAKWDHKFRAAVESNVPYSDWLLGLALGPASQGGLKKQTEVAQPSSMMVKPVKAPKEKKAKEAESPARETSPVPSQPPQSIEVIAFDQEDLRAQVGEGVKATGGGLHAGDWRREASAEASHIISAISEIPTVPAPCDTEAVAVKEECKECHDHTEPPVTAEVQPDVEAPLRERPVEEVAARLAQQDLEEQDTVASVAARLDDSLANSAKATLQAIGAQETALQAIARHTHTLKEAMEAEVPPEEKSSQWKDLEAALADRTSAVKDAATALLNANEALESLKSEIDTSKGLKVSAVRPVVLAAEENLHNMVVDLDKVVTKVFNVWLSSHIWLFRLVPSQLIEQLINARYRQRVSAAAASRSAAASLSHSSNSCVIASPALMVPA